MIPNKAVTDRSYGRKSNIHILPLSVEDNSTITGTINILEKFGSDFSLPV